MKKVLLAVVIFATILVLFTACSEPTPEVVDYGPWSMDAYFSATSEVQSKIIDYVCEGMGFASDVPERTNIIKMFDYSETADETVDGIIETYEIDDEVLIYPELTAYYSFDFDYSDMTYTDYSNLSENARLSIYIDLLIDLGEDWADPDMRESVKQFIEIENDLGTPLDQIIEMLNDAPSLLY